MGTRSPRGGGPRGGEECRGGTGQMRRPRAGVSWGQQVAGCAGRAGSQAWRLRVMTSWAPASCPEVLLGRCLLWAPSTARPSLSPETLGGKGSSPSGHPSRPPLGPRPPGLASAFSHEASVIATANISERSACQRSWASSVFVNSSHHTARVSCRVKASSEPSSVQSTS